MISPANGTLLIAEPILKDLSFVRSVVLLCKHDDEDGTFGFVLNRKLNTTLNEIIVDMIDWKLPVFLGGPVHTDTLHYIHQYPEYFDDAVQVVDGVYWGGNFELMKKLIKEGTINANKIKFFLGYSGWSQGQLLDEIKEDCWASLTANDKLVFQTKEDDIWKICLNLLGGKYKMMVHYPTDPQLN